jgi:hypothetical protein
MTALVPFALALMLASCDRTEEDTSQATTEGPTETVETKPTDVPVPPGFTLWRWGNTTILVDDSLGIAVSRYLAPPQRLPPSGGPEIDLIRGNSQVGINGTTGEISYRAVEAADDPDFDAVLKTISVEHGQRLQSLPWPYSEETLGIQQVKQEQISYWEPDPASGLVVRPGCSDSPTSGGVCYVLIENSRSRRAIDTETGAILPGFERVVTEDAESFDRWTHSVEVRS